MRLSVSRNPESLAAMLRRDHINPEEGAWLDEVAATWGGLGWTGTEAVEITEGTVTFDDLVARLRSADLGTAPLPKSQMLETVRAVL